MEAPYRKDLGHLSWEQVFARQAQRADLIDAWIDALGLAAGDRVLDVGAGPGFVSLALAERVGPRGTVYALDRSADALAHLARLQAARGIGRSSASRRTRPRSTRRHPAGRRAGHHGAASCRRSGRDPAFGRPLPAARRAGGDRRIPSRGPVHRRPAARGAAGAGDRPRLVRGSRARHDRLSPADAGALRAVRKARCPMRLNRSFFAARRRRNRLAARRRVGVEPAADGGRPCRRCASLTTSRPSARSAS